MITKDEIDRKSDELEVHTSNVQRDYVFGWLLAGVFQPGNALGARLILKGGNCFRKAYIPGARFSNDLDFSTEEELTEEVFLGALKQACAYARDQSGIEFLPEECRIGVREGVEGEESTLYEARVYFKSFYGEEEFTLKVKLDVLEFDRLYLPKQTRNLIHDYSDFAVCRANITCHKLEELLASKLKALLHRQHSPDLYDFIYTVFFQKALIVSRLEVISTFLKKTIYEPDPAAARGLLLELPFHVFQGFWAKFLTCPKPTRIEFGDAETAFKSVIAEIFALIEPRFSAAGYGFGGGARFFGAKHRELIFEAGRLERKMRLLYSGHERLIEPYSLTFKRRADGVGREYFYGWDSSGGSSGQIGIKSFVPDKIQGLEMTEEKFEPRFPIELVKGPGFFSRPFSTRPRAFGVGQSRAHGFLGAGVKIRCAVCQKVFTRTSSGSRLGPHKDKFGNMCIGRYGFPA